MAAFTLVDGGTVYSQAIQVHAVLPIVGSSPPACFLDGNGPRTAVLGTVAAVAGALGGLVPLTDAYGQSIAVNPIQVFSVRDAPVGAFAYIEEATGARLVVQGTAAAVAAALGL